MPQTTVTLGSLNRVRLTITCHHFVIIHQLTVINPSKSQTFCRLLTQNFTLKQSHQRFKFRVQPEPDIFKTETVLNVSTNSDVVAAGKQFLAVGKVSNQLS